jgi:uncharacterized coiled-coil protein SlyX
MPRALFNLNPLTEYAILFISAVGLYFQIVWSRRGTTLGPTLLTTLGIFFCFLGIALGLADFDPNDAKTSVPHLLQGIRTSFWSSVTGIGWALTIKIRLAMFGEAAISATGPAHQATVDDLATQLVRLNSGLGDHAESSVLANLKLGRQDNNDRLDRLCNSLETYAERSAEANSRLLVEALSHIVVDFNAKLSEQFGDNFKELNAAVAQMVTWLAHYEQQLNRLIEQEKATCETMAAASRHYSDLVNKSTVFVSTAESLGRMMGSLDAERENLASALTILAGLIDNASAGLPQIEKSIVEMTEQIARGVQANQEALGSVLRNAWQSVQAHNQYLTAMLAKSLDAANKDVADYAKRLDPELKQQAIA